VLVITQAKPGRVSRLCLKSGKSGVSALWAALGERHSAISVPLGRDGANSMQCTQRSQLHVSDDGMSVHAAYMFVDQYNRASQPLENALLRQGGFSRMHRELGSGVHAAARWKLDPGEHIDVERSSPVVFLEVW